MLESHKKGFAVMSKDLSGISFESDILDVCKIYCKNSDVIAERIPHVCGISIDIYWFEISYWYKPIYFPKYGQKNIFWLHFELSKNYFHKTGKIVFKS
jgi:hypothetical protein